MVLGVRGPFYGLLIDAVAEHGREALEGLREVFELEWEASSESTNWPVPIRRSVIQCFVRKGSSRQWATAALQELDDSVPGGGDVFSRVEECMKQAEAWLDVGDPERTRWFLELTLGIGFGVGYRKDYQMDQWIDWLVKINEIEPEKAAGRISQFACAVRDLEESTDGSATNSAATRLIAASFRWSPVRAVQIFVWLADQGIINYWTGMCALLKQALKAPDPPMRAALLAASEFLFPFDSVGDAVLMTDLVERLSDSEEEDQAIADIHVLVSKVRLNASSSVRPAWLRGLVAGVDNAGLRREIFEVDAVDLKGDEEQRDISNQLVLSDGSEPLGYREVQERVTSISDLRLLLGQESEESFFDWTPLVILMIQHENDERKLAEIVDLFRNWRRPSGQVLAHISMRLAELGNEQSAWEIGEEALDLSSRFDWHPRFDGGSRVLALKALSHIDQGRALPLVYDTLVQDLEGTVSLVNVITEALEDILALLDSPATVHDIWSEIESHITPLLGFSRSVSTLDAFAEEIATDTPNRALIELMAAHLDHPCRALQQAAQRCLGQLLLDRTSDVTDVLIDLIERTDQRQERALMLVDAVSSIDPGAVTDFHDQVCQLTDSPSWLIRTTGRAIINNCAWNAPATGPGLAVLPPVYHLSLPPPDRDPLFVDHPSSLGEPIPDSENPVRVVTPFYRDIEAIADVADVPVQNLCRRVVEIMGQLARRDLVWSAEAEKDLQSKLSRTGIRLPFVRPRARVARMAIFRAVSELVDAGKISIQGAALLEYRLRSYEPGLIMVEPAHRPANIAKMDKAQISSSASEWVHNVSEALPHADWDPENRMAVLAEVTTPRNEG